MPLQCSIIEQPTIESREERSSVSEEVALEVPMTRKKAALPILALLFPAVGFLPAFGADEGVNPPRAVSRRDVDPPGVRLEVPFAPASTTFEAQVTVEDA